MDGRAPRIEVVIAALEQQPVLAKMLELYAEDFRAFHSVERGPEGRFVYERLPLYWSEAGRYPFLVMVDGAAAGFVFVKQGSEAGGGPDVWDMAEFFVVREARRKGVGSEVGRQVWGRFPGPWEVRVLEANLPAVGFWSRAIRGFSGGAASERRMEKDGVGRLVFSFEVR